MDPLEPSTRPKVELSAKAEECLARCVAVSEGEDTPLDEEGVLRLNAVASQLNSVATRAWETEERRTQAWDLMNNLLEAERAAMKWLKADYVRTELLRMAGDILEHRRGGIIVSANDIKAAWACLCRTAPQMKSGALILHGDFSLDFDSEDSSYDPENDDMSVDEPDFGDYARPESKIESDEELIVLGPDSEIESDEEAEDAARVMKTSLADDCKQDMTEKVSLVANALLESTAPPEVFNQLQMAFRLISIREGCTSNNPFTENMDILSHLADFVDDKEFLFFASVCKKWKDAWGQRPTSTTALAPATSVSQLSFSFECGLRRTTSICTTAIEMGRLDLLRCARANGCPWQGDMCKLAAEAGDLELLQWARTRNYPWGPETCALLARGGHLAALQWCQQNGCSWDVDTLEEAGLEDHDNIVEWAVANGCPDWSDSDY